MNDIRFAFRKLRQSPAFTSIAVITLALGIGLNTAIFSLVNDLFLRGLPFKEPARVVHFFGGDKSRDLVDLPVSAPRFEHLRDGQTICESLAGENFFAFTLTGLGDPVQVFGGRLTSNYFDVLGVRPILGRNFLPEEQEGADVALITKNFWQKRMGGDPNVIGRSITLDGMAHTIVGVLPHMPASWFGANPTAEVWTTKPFQIPGFTYERMMRGTSFLRVIGRLKPGVSVKQAKAALPSFDQSYNTQFPNKIDSTLTTTLKTLPQDVTENLQAGFATLFAAVSFVLLIACSNVANLLLVRFSGRRREIALRMAIGASRTSIVRLFVFESLPLVPRMASNFLPLEANTATSLSLPVLAFTIALSLLTGLLMGIYPALQGSHADLVDGLKEGGRGTSGSVRQQRFRKILVGAQVALSVTLLAGAALLITSFIRLSQQNIGFRSQNLWTGAVTLPVAQYPDAASRQRFVEQTLNALRDVPGLESATISGDIPLAGGNRTLYARADRDVPPIEKRANGPSHDIAPGYFRTWGVPLLAGRDFNEHDSADAQNVCLISQAGAKKVFPNENPIGKTLLVTSLGVPVEIVGIVGDVRSIRVAEAPGMEFYRPSAFQSGRGYEASAIRPEHGQSGSRHCGAANDGRRCRPGAGSGAADDVAPGNFRRRRFALGEHWNLWRSRLHGRTADRRDRRANGARRTNTRRAAPGRESGNEAGCYWIGDRDCIGLCARSLDRVAALRGFSAQSGSARRRNRIASRDRVDRMPVTSAASGLSRPGPSVAHGINQRPRLC